MGQTPTLHLLYSCPFCWKVRGLLEHLDVDVNYAGVNGGDQERRGFADWEGARVHTKIQHHVDPTLNCATLTRPTTERWPHDAARQDEWMN